MSKALREVCDDAVGRRASILVDAEQQFVQPGIDTIALELMRKYNHGSRAIVYNTYQAYLKSTPETLRQHLRLAAAEKFTIGIKVVRGAYFSKEPRHMMQDTKQKTDDCYNMLARQLLDKSYPGVDRKEFPHIDVFLATHNEPSVLEAHALQRARAEKGLTLVDVQYGQLLGMADGVSCRLLQLKDGKDSASPAVYKCLSWGTLSDCTSYLLRRAVENKDAVLRTKAEYLALRSEVWRRLKTGLGFG